MAVVGKNMPDVVTVGDTLTFTRSYGDYKPQDGWTLSYALVNANNQITFTSTDNGDSTHLVDVEAITSDGWSAGTYQWVAYVENNTSPSERVTVDRGTVTVKPDYTDAAVDDRSHVKKTLDLIEAEIEARVSGSTESYSIAGRSLSKTPMPELLEMRSKYKAWYDAEVRAERVARGLGTKKRVLVRFS